MSVIRIGVDLGQRHDPTAIAVVEETDKHFFVRHLDQLPLGTSYPAVVERIADICRRLREQYHMTPELYVDATGLGTPVVDQLHAVGVSALVFPVYFTHGDRRAFDGREIRLGKAWLVSRLQVLIQSRRLHLPQTPEAETLVRELLTYEIRVDENANDRYGAFRVGSHDDLVTALGLAVQTDGSSHPLFFIISTRSDDDF